MDGIQNKQLNQAKIVARPYSESQQLLDSMLERTGKMLNSSEVYIYTIDDKKKIIELTAAIGTYQKWLGHAMRLEDTLCEKVLTSGQLRTGYRFKNYADLDFIWGNAVDAVVAVPLKLAGQIVGVLGVGLPSGSQVLKHKDKVVLESIAEVTAMVLQRIYPFYTKQCMPAYAGEGNLQHIHERMTSLFSVINKHGIFEFIVKSHEDLLGYSSEELVGVSVFSLIHLEDRLAVMELFENLSLTGEEHIPLIMEYRFRHKEGWYMWLETTALIMRDGHSQVVGILLSSKDITKRKETQAELEENEEKFRLLFNNANDAICLAELAPNGLPDKIMEVNQVLCQLWGFTRSELLGASVLRLMPKWDSDEFSLSRQKLLKGEDVLFEITHEDRNGQTFSVEVNAQAFNIKKQPVVMMIGRNTSERRRIEKEMLKLERLNVIGEMAAGIGHEVRNPLTTVCGFLQMMRKREKDTKSLEYFNIMIDELDRANGIISEFLAIAKNKNIEFEVIDLNEVVKAIAPLIGADASLVKKKLVLELNSSSRILADQKELRQLIFNLARNGLDAMSEEGTLSICTQDTPLGVQLMIKDQGNGIPPLVLEKLGTPFFTTKEHGTGLGLVVCYSIAEHHHTKLEVDTCEKGTTFSIVFAKLDNN